MPDSGDSRAFSWPEPADVEYFESELKMAYAYLDMAAAAAVDARECSRRALAIYISLSGWLQGNGGNSQLEQRLADLRAQVAAMPDDS